MFTEGRPYLVYKDHAKYMIPMKSSVNTTAEMDADRLFKEYLLRFPKAKTYTYDEAKVYIDPTKSAAYPNSAMGIGTKGRAYEIHDSMYRRYVNLISKRVLWLIEFYEQIFKEEIRPTKKILAEKARSICSGPMVPNHVGCMLFGDVQRIIASMPFAMTHTNIGWTFFYGGWNDVATYFGERFVQSNDAVKWDSSLLARLDDKVSYMVFKYMVHPQYQTPENLNLLEWLLWHEHHSFCVLPHGSVTYIEEGMKSGSYRTLLFNSLANFYLFLYSYCKWLGPEEAAKVTLTDIEVSKRFLFTGDDNVVDCDDGYSFEAHQDGYKDWNVTFDPFDSYDHFYNKTYLSMTTLKIGDYCYPVPDLDRLIVSSSYKKKSNSPEEYIGKLNSLASLAVARPTLMKQLISFRNMLIDLINKPELYEQTHTAEQIVAMHHPIYEALELSVHKQ